MALFPSILAFLQPHLVVPAGHEMTQVFTPSGSKGRQVVMRSGKRLSIAHVEQTLTGGHLCLQRLTSWETFPKTLKKQGSSDCVTDEVTVWIKTPAIEKKREEEKPSQPFAA